MDGIPVSASEAVGLSAYSFLGADVTTGEEVNYIVGIKS